MSRLLIIGCGGFIGAIARYVLTAWVQNKTTSDVPLGTMAVNVIGCFALGFLVAWLLSRPDSGENWSLFLRVGLLGAFTTFSTLGFETVELASNGNWRAAGLSLAGNLVLGFLGVFLGTASARALTG